MKTDAILNLQLFADGESAEGAESAQEAETDAGQRLRALGVPEEKVRRHEQRMTARAPKENAPDESGEETGADTAEESEEQPTEKAGRMAWDDIMKDPEYQKEMEAAVRAKLGTAGKAEEALGKLTPALELLARKYGLDTENIDHEALAKAVSDDSEYYEQKAMEMGVSVETAKKIDEETRKQSRDAREAAMTVERQKIIDHFKSLEDQGKEMKKTFPAFDLRAELQNPVFARMTSPSGGISVEDAYYAVHRKDIQAAAMQVAAQKTAQKLSNAIRSGAKRPDENGISARAASSTAFDYRSMSPAQRAAFKDDLRTRMARGEKVYPRGGK